MKVRLTDIAVRNLKPPLKGQATYLDADANLPGFGVRVTAKGVKSFVLVHGAQRTRETLGRYPTITLQQARQAARTRLSELTLSGYQRTPKLTFAEAFARYEQAHLVHLRSGDQVKRAIANDAIPLLGRKLLHEITDEDVSDVLNRIRERGSEYQRTNTRAYLRTFFSWCMRVDNLGSDRLKANPAAETSRGKSVSRDRVLSDLELVAVWYGTEALGWPFMPLIRLLVLSGQRRDEVGGIEWPELHDSIWTIPAARAKNNQIHDVPLPPEAQVIIATVPHLNSCSLLFSTTGTTPVSGFSKAKAKLDAATQAWLDAYAEKHGRRRIILAPWRLHDLRRNVSTGLARMGYPQHVVEKLLNHRSGVTSGIAGVYNRYRYWEERKQALAAWTAHVTSLVAAHAPEPVSS